MYRGKRTAARSPSTSNQTSRSLASRYCPLRIYCASWRYWWIAHCEEVPEARTQGETKEEARENLKDAIAFILEDYSPEELKRLRVGLASEESELLAL